MGPVRLNRSDVEKASISSGLRFVSKEGSLCFSIKTGTSQYTAPLEETDPVEIFYRVATAVVEKCERNLMFVSNKFISQAAAVEKNYTILVRFCPGKSGKGDVFVSALHKDTGIGELTRKYTRTGREDMFFLYHLAPLPNP